MTPVPSTAGPERSGLSFLGTAIVSAGALLPSAGSLAAQDPCPRTPQPLTVVAGAATLDPQLAMPKQNLPGDPANGLAPTARLAYAVWPERPVDDVLRLAVSDDGGWSWSPSRVQTIWTEQAGESLNTFSVQVFAEGNSVFVVLLTNRMPNGMPDPNRDNSVWVVASNDQGRTFQSIQVPGGLYTPLAGGLDLDKCLTVRGALSLGVLHLAFEADYDDVNGSGPAVDDDVFYQAVRFDPSGNLVRILPEEVRLETTPPGTEDADTPYVAADGPVVAVTWEGEVDVLTAVSQDLGATFAPPYDHTNFTTNESIDVPTCAVWQSTVVVVQTDSRDPATSDDALYVSISNDAGATFVDGVRLTTAGDVDPFTFCRFTQAGLLLTWADDRNGTDEVFAIVDPGFGAGLLAGTYSTVPLSTRAGRQDVVSVDGFGEVFAVGLTAGSASSQDAVVATTFDGGRSWTEFLANDFGASGLDTDELAVAVGFNLDVPVTFVGDGAGSDLFATGLKAGLLEPVTARRGLRYRGLASQAGQLVAFLPSLSAPVSNGIVVPGVTGLALNYTADALTLGAIADPGFYVAADANGDAVLPVRNFAPALGSTLHWIALPLGAAGLSRTASDPFAQN